MTSPPLIVWGRRAADSLALLTSAAYLWCSYTLVNDHFGRISPARQILVFGDVPFRDFLDPGFFLNLYSSAFMQWLLGYNLLGEAVLNVACMAIGYGFAFRLAVRGSGSRVIGALALAAALTVTPRAYDYDKVLFYPWGLYACWKYVNHPTRSALAHLAMVIVAGGLFRYDTAVFLGAAAVVGMVACHWRDGRLLLGRLALLAAMSAALAAPVLLFVQANSGIGPAIDQVMTYAQREGARTRVFQITPLRIEPGTTMRQLLGDPVAAATVLSYVGLVLSVAALVSATVQARAMASSQLAQRLSAATLVAAATLVIVRDPVLARIGAVMPVIVVLAAVVLADAFPRVPDARAWVAARGGAWYRTGMVGLAIGVTLALAASATVLARRPQLAYLSRWRVAELAETPPTLGLAPRYEPLVSYVRACTRPTDRVLATWFVPELYFYSGRAFAGGLPVMFGGHWSEDRFERHILRRLEAETVPLVIMRFVPRQVDVDYLREVWPLLSDYVARHYEVGATTDFGTKDLTYQIWVRRGVVPANRYGPAGLPCYATAS